MLKMGIPVGAVRQALQKEGKDPSIATMDPNISYASQSVIIKPEVPLKDDPDYAKFFKVSACCASTLLASLRIALTVFACYPLSRCSRWGFLTVRFSRLSRRKENTLGSLIWTPRSRILAKPKERVQTLRKRSLFKKIKSMHNSLRYVWSGCFASVGQLYSPTNSSFF